MPTTMVTREHHRALSPAERRRESGHESDYHSSEYAEGVFRDPVALVDDLQRLEDFYRREARDALDAARACREWRANLRQQRTSEAP